MATFLAFIRSRSSQVVMENASSRISVSTVSGRPLESQEHLIRVSQKNLYHKISKKWKDYLLVAVAFLITMSIFSLVIFLALNNRNSYGLCTSPECIRSANNLLQAMNTSVSPCDNFYKFACDNWRSEHAMEEPRFINNWFEERNKLIQRDLLEYLEQENSEDEPFPVHQARTVYDACLDIESINEYGVERLGSLLDDLGLPRLPMVGQEPLQPWSRSLGKIKRYLAKDVLVGFTVMSSLRNSTYNQLALASPEESDLFLRRKRSDDGTETMLEKSLQKGNTEVVRLWREFSTKVMKFLAGRSNITWTAEIEKEFSLSSLRILLMKQNLTQLENSEEVIGPFLNDIPDEFEITQLQELVDNSSRTGESKISWETYFESIFEDTDVVLSFPEDKILVYKRVYFELLSEFLDDFTEKDLELLLWWEVVYALAPHVHEELKILKESYVSKVLSYVQRDTRTIECVKITYNFMDSAVAYSMVSRLDPTLIDKISDMISNIQETFIQAIYDLSWMDKNTKKETVKKVKSIRKFIGIPDWISDKERLEAMYNVTVNDTTHLDNLLTILNAEMIDILSSLRIENDKDISQFNPLDINAYYDPSGNSISVPAAIMQFPFYDLGLESLNYGAIGSVLGHEMTHALDSYGRRFDLNGNLVKWWSNRSVTEFEKRTECFVNSYDTYFIPAVNATVNGSVTLSENLADDGGLRNAYQAYRAFTSRENLLEPRLPGLEKYTQKQLFFLAHANMWCSEYTEEALHETLDYDEHSPQFVRVNRVLQNMKDFSTAWGCPKGSKMNPDDKCQLWLD